MDNLGYQLLNDKEKAAYRIIEDAVRKHSRSCDITRVPRDVNLMHVLLAVLGDYPDVIYFNRTLLRTSGSLFTKQISFIGIVSPKQEKEREEKLAKELSNAVFEIDKRARNDREILQGISEYLQRTVTYDMKELNAGGFFGSKAPDSHNAYGALVNKLAVCDGFSSAFCLIAKEFGFRSIIVEGKSNRNNRSSKVNHAWNIVEFEGDFYHMDVTWDSANYSLFNENPYFYFGLTDDEIAIDHEWDYKTTPPCNRTKLSFYEHNKLVAYSESQIDEIASKQLRLEQKLIRVKIAPGIPVPDDDGESVGRRVLNQMSKLGISGSIRYSWNGCSRCFTALLV